MIFKLKRIIRWAMSASLPVILFRLYQELKLTWMFRASGWDRLSKRANRCVLESGELSSCTVLLTNVSPALDNTQRTWLKNVAQNVMTSRFKLFGHSVPDLDDCDFSADWRFGQRWAPQYFRRYHFYEEQKQLPYDVKFPWELSRLHYLVQVLAWHVADNIDATSLHWVLGILHRWRRDNPLAYSVNWYPMEASMRMISLVLLLDLVKILNGRESDQTAASLLVEMGELLLTMIREHGDFIWLNREFTDVRGNHFAANIVALLLGYQALVVQGLGPRHWRRYASHWLEKEIMLQFCADGVHFEKSCGYHKLVLELFMLAAIALDRSGTPLNVRAQQRLANAAKFSDAISRPDGLAANFGDTDNAVALPFLLDQPRSHGPVVELARTYFDQPVGTHAFNDVECLATAFVFGYTGYRASDSSGPEVLEFPVGGYIIVRNSMNGFFFMLDVGEVGMMGRGGHGHNDLLAFELCIDGHLLVVDPGCSGYTSDLAKMARYRSTSAHATVQLYGEEMARFAGHWGIHNDAQPTGVSVARTKQGARISAGHGGYERIGIGSHIARHLDIDAERQTLILSDEISVPQDDVIARWHFPVGVLSVALAENGTALLSDSAAFELTSKLPMEVLEAPFSVGYGQEVSGRVITAETKLAAGTHTFCFKFSKKTTIGD